MSANEIAALESVVDAAPAHDPESLFMERPLAAHVADSSTGQAPSKLNLAATLHAYRCGHQDETHHEAQGPWRKAQDQSYRRPRNYTQLQRLHPKMTSAVLRGGTRGEGLATGGLHVDCWPQVDLSPASATPLPSSSHMVSRSTLLQGSTKMDEVHVCSL